MNPVPAHPAIATRHALQERQQARAGMFEPVATPAYRVRLPERLRRYWRAIGPSLLGLAFLAVIAGTAAGWLAVVRS